MRLILIYLIIFGSTTIIHAQDYFLKNFSEPINVTSQSAIVSLPDEGVVHVTHLQTQEIVIRRINKCGEQIWAKEIKHPSLSLDLADIKADNSGNFIFAGNLSNGNSASQPFLMSLSFDGMVNYLKKINLPANVQSYTYSFLTNDAGEFYLYFNYNVSGSSLPSISVAKLDNQGNFIWLKSYPGISDWGRAFATSDGGLLFRSGSTLVKTDSDGDVNWSKTYTQLGYIDYPIEVDGGYILFKYPSGQVNNTTNLIKLSTNGEVLWVSNDFTNFSPNRGVLRSNGNVLFTGNAQQGVGLLEVDSANGSIVRFKRYNPANAASLSGIDLHESVQGDILVSGIDNSGFVGANLYLRVDSLLQLPGCTTDDLQISSIRTPNVTDLPASISVINRSNTLLSLSNEVFTERTIPNGSFIPQCVFQKDRGNYRLGNDTILCPKEFLVLGNPNSTYDDYTWSNGAKTKQITVSNAGTYSLEVVTACDTLRDTIVVSVYPDVNLSLGNDTSFCENDSILLSSNLSLSNYLWSTGATTSSIYVKQSGIYWLETDANCGKVRDSIGVTELMKRTRLQLGPDTVLCPNDSLILGDALSDFVNFRWQNGETSQFIHVNIAGTYSIEAFNQCDTLRDTIVVNSGQTLVPNFTISKELVKTRELFQLDNTTLGNTTASWKISDGTLREGNSINHEFLLAGNYTIEMTVQSEDGCVFSQVKNIEVQASDFYLPTVFSPNKDRVNDEFFPVGQDIVNYEMTIYSRWGKEVFSKKDIPWNGRNRNESIANEGTYYYKVLLYFNHGGTSTLDGNVLLVR